MQTGHISKLFHEQEYGVIRTKEGEELHFHKHCLWNVEFAELTEGQEVEFEVQPSYKGQLAFHIRPYTREQIFMETVVKGGADVEGNDQGI